ncbi:hypothetical protein LRS06_20640 [Hymenobacter sp. J193]|uniref:hypothetical protein n=1 Tax=Hymenobacter sp. J193 TaxID=2898429 RepID=UPI0021506E2F|nr:hypothetical protein [Hymenobacter sp. J193]MCR5890138.1 hypothetical protein [Hymenobacter sp. J193]
MKEQLHPISYTTLKATHTCLVAVGEAQLALTVSHILAGSQLEKPVLHNAPQQLCTNQYSLHLETDEIESIHEILLDTEAASVGSNGESTGQTSFYASLVDTWSDLLEQANQ